MQIVYHVHNNKKLSTIAQKVKNESIANTRDSGVQTSTITALKSLAVK